MQTGEIKILSVGGSIIIPKTGFDLDFLNNFRKLIIEKIKKGDRFIIITGGGNTARMYQAAAKDIGQLKPDDVDWMGIHATRLNAHFMRTILRDYAHPIVVRDFTQKLNWTEPVLVASGWKPGWTTDYCATKFAELYGGKQVINLSNIDYIFDSDPKTNPNAKKFENMTWSEIRKIVGDKHVPGANVPFDPIASREAEMIGLTVSIVNGKNLKEVEKALDGEKFQGTVIGMNHEA